MPLFVCLFTVGSGINKFGPLKRSLAVMTTLVAVRPKVVEAACPATRPPALPVPYTIGGGVVNFTISDGCGEFTYSSGGSPNTIAICVIGHTDTISYDRIYSFPVHYVLQAPTKGPQTGNWNGVSDTGADHDTTDGGGCDGTATFWSTGAERAAQGYSTDYYPVDSNTGVIASTNLDAAMNKQCFGCTRTGRAKVAAQLNVTAYGDAFLVDGITSVVEIAAYDTLGVLTDCLSIDAGGGSVTLKNTFILTVPPLIPIEGLFDTLTASVAFTDNSNYFLNGAGAIYFGNLPDSYNPMPMRACSNGPHYQVHSIWNYPEADCSDLFSTFALHPVLQVNGWSDNFPCTLGIPGRGFSGDFNSITQTSPFFALISLVGTGVPTVPTRVSAFSATVDTNVANGVNCMCNLGFSKTWSDWFTCIASAAGGIVCAGMTDPVDRASCFLSIKYAIDVTATSATSPGIVNAPGCTVSSWETALPPLSTLTQTCGFTSLVYSMQSAMYAIPFAEDDPPWGYFSVWYPIASQCLTRCYKPVPMGTVPLHMKSGGGDNVPHATVALSFEGEHLGECGYLNQKPFEYYSDTQCDIWPDFRWAPGGPSVPDFPTAFPALWTSADISSGWPKCGIYDGKQANVKVFKPWQPVASSFDSLSRYSDEVKYNVVGGVLTSVDITDLEYEDMNLTLTAPNGVTFSNEDTDPCSCISAIQCANITGSIESGVNLGIAINTYNNTHTYVRVTAPSSELYAFQNDYYIVDPQIILGFNYSLDLYLDAFDNAFAVTFLASCPSGCSYSFVCSMYVPDFENDESGDESDSTSPPDPSCGFLPCDWSLSGFFTSPFGALIVSLAVLLLIGVVLACILPGCVSASVNASSKGYSRVDKAV